jgi:hypothetical protein
MQNVRNEMNLETFASVATGPRFDMSFPTTPVSFSAMLSRAGDQADPTNNVIQGAGQTHWPSDADVQQPAENDSTEELYW